MSGKSAKMARRRAANAAAAARAPAVRSWKLPPGIQLAPFDSPEALWSIDEASSAFIADYDSPRSLAARRERRRNELDALFADDPASTPSIFAIAATNEAMDGLCGAALLEPFCGEDLLAQDRDAGRLMARAHRVLAALFVVPDERGRSIGSALLDVASLAVVGDGGRYLEGFVDDQDGSVDFYRRAGAYVGAHNESLPPRPPVNLKTMHYPGKDGHWFSVDGWARHHDKMSCSRCGGAFDFLPANGGDLRCPRCQWLGGSPRSGR
ncbi:GNAT family N-acetyltransferase [Brachybacterium tyrofermentans]|uniref:GNAT family N-acetyltransferase n=1 Tax=Brachybacterium tyrofermentans TaxID=47848 RepID=UPI003FD63231